MALPAPPTPATAGRAALSGWATHPADRRSALLPLHESTTRYDHDQKVLSFLLVCRICGIEKLVHRQPYEPLFEPHPALGSRREASRVSSS
jgi:hypothetical protein